MGLGGPKEENFRSLRLRYVVGGGQTCQRTRGKTYGLKNSAYCRTAKGEARKKNLLLGLRFIGRGGGEE